MAKFMKNGFFVIGDGEGFRSASFIEFSDISNIRFQRGSSDRMNQKWFTQIVFKSGNHNTYFAYEDMRIAEKYYETVLNAWMEFNENILNLEEKIDQLLSHIDVIPGGDEYLKVKDQFEKSS